MKRILVVKLSALGDIVHCLPAVRQLQSAFPEAQIDWLIENKNRILIDRSVLNVRVLPIDTKGLRSNVRWGSVGLILQWIKELRSARYDCAIDFQGLIKSALLTYLSGAPRRIGFSRVALREPLARLFYTEQVTPKQVHIMDQLQELLPPRGGTAMSNEQRPLGAVEATTWVIPSAIVEPVPSRLPVEGYIVIHPGAGWPTKRWPLTRFSELARRLAADGLPVVITLAPDEADGEIVSGENIYTMTTTLDELMALCAKACLFIGGDTGPLHIAAAMQVPLVAIFGPTSSERNGPINREDIVVERPLACRPCYKRKACPLGHWNCMEELSVEDVYQACLQRLRVRRNGRSKIGVGKR